MFVVEGKTKLIVPASFLKKAHFYNPEMELARDLTVLLLLCIGSDNWVVLDALTGIGARGVRIAKETDIKEVWLNDYSKDALRYAKRNVEINRVKTRTKIFGRDANVLMFSYPNSFDYIDIDPFGSPTYYLNSAAKAMKKVGVIGVTATDTGNLAGTFPLTCFRKYGVKSFKTEFMHELGVRILIASVALTFARWDYSFQLLLSYWYKHYYRVWGIARKGKRNANKMVKENIGYLSYCQKCLWRSVGKKPICSCKNCGSEIIIVPNVWIGKIEDVAIIEKCEKKLRESDWLRKRDELKKLLGFLKNEDTQVFFYDLHELAGKWKVKVPKKSVVCEKLKEMGYFCYATHFSPVGIKTNASLQEIRKIFSIV